jgi:ABC-type multidrug transport system ATPase subunit
VSRLCSRIAIILEGTVVAEGSPAALVESLRGRLWRKPVAAQTEIDALRPHVRVISTRYANGQTFVNVLSEQRPDASFEPVGGDLQDVYFATIAAEDRAAA